MQVIRQIARLSLTLSIPSALVAIARTHRLLTADPHTALQHTQTLFPTNLIIHLDNHTLHLYTINNTHTTKPNKSDTHSTPPPSYVCWDSNGSFCAAAPHLEPIRVELPSLVHDLWYSELPYPVSLTPAALLSLALSSRVSFASLVADRTPARRRRVRAWRACRGRRLALLLGGGAAARHGARQVPPPTRCTPLRTNVSFDDGTAGVWSRARASSARPRSPSRATTTSPRSGLGRGSRVDMAPRMSAAPLALRAALVLGAREAHLLQGFSFVHAQRWQYASAYDDDDEEAEREALHETIVSPELDAVERASVYQPLGLALELLCSHEPQSRADGGSVVVRCSSETAERAVQRWRASRLLRLATLLGPWGRAALPLGGHPRAGLPSTALHPDRSHLLCAGAHPLRGAQPAPPRRLGARLGARRHQPRCPRRHAPLCVGRGSPLDALRPQPRAAAPSAWRRADVRQPRRRRPHTLAASHRTRPRRSVPPSTRCAGGTPACASAVSVFAAWCCYVPQPRMAGSREAARAI